MRAHELQLAHFARLYNEGGLYNFGDSRIFLCSPAVVTELFDHLIESSSPRAARQALVRAGRAMGARFAASLPEQVDGVVERRRSVASVARLLGLVESMLPREVGDADDLSFEMHWYGAVDHASPPDGDDADAAHLGCTFTLGFISGYTSEVAETAIYFRESSCTSRGDTRCIAHGLPRAQWDRAAVEELDSLYGLGPAPPPRTLEEVEREHILRAIDTATTRREAAEMLGIGEATLYRRLRKYVDEGYLDE